MPIYEYRCQSCGRKASIFFRTIASADSTPTCPHCGADQLQRLMSRVWTQRDRGSDIEPSYEADGVPFYGPDPYGGDDIYGDDSFADFGGGESEDVAELAREARSMAQAMGEPLDAEFDQALRQVEQGADPDDVFGELDAKEQSSSEPED